MSFTAMVTYR